MVARAIRPAKAVCPMRRRMDASRPAQTQPRNSTPRSGGLHPRGKCTEDDPGHRAETFGHGQPGHQQSDHQRVVVRPADESQKGKGRPHADEDCVGRIVFQRSGQGRCGGHGQCEAGDLQEAEQDEVRQNLVARSLVEQAVEAQERGTVGRFGAGPGRVGHLVERRRPEHFRSVRVRVDVVAHHFALRRIGVDVTAEERWCQQ